MISVIIPVYNAGHYLNRCVDSILNSTCQDFEIILVNDGSTDNSPDICRQYCAQDSRIKLITQKNQGVSAARNKGLDACSGEWIIFVDADDFIDVDFLSAVACREYQDADFLLFEFAQAGSDTSLEALPACLVTRYNKKNMLRLIQRILVPSPLPEGSNADFRSPCARAYRRSVIERYSIRFSRSIFIGEDLLFNLEYQLRADSGVYIRKPVYHYDMHSGSSSRSFNPNLRKNHLRLQQAILNTLKNCDAFPVLEKYYYSYSLENMAYVLIREIFSPQSPRSYRQNRLLCRKMRKNNIYRHAMRFNRKCGILPRRILVFFFHLRCYPAVCLISRISYHYLSRRDAF